jgi:hypothetical protein
VEHAVLVGIDAYLAPNALRGCLNDIADLEHELVRARGFHSTSIQVLRDADATAGAIRSTLTEAVRRLRVHDRFVFWYSGHGSQLVRGDATTDVICPHDFAFTPETSVTVEDFHAIFSQIPAGVEAVWGSDSCHSGDLDSARNVEARRFRRFAGPRPPAPTAPPRTFHDVSTRLAPIALIAACRSDQLSSEMRVDGRDCGVFTHYFLRALDRFGTAPLGDLVQHVDSALRAERYAQTPQLSGPRPQLARPFLQGASA